MLGVVGQRKGYGITLHSLGYIQPRIYLYLSVQKGELEVEIDGGNYNEDSQFTLDDYDSEDEDGGSKSKSNGEFSPAVMEMMKR